MSTSKKDKKSKKSRNRSTRSKSKKALSEAKVEEIQQKLKAKDVAQWSDEYVDLWLRSLGLPDYSKSFVENSISGRELIELTEADLRQLGVASMGHRKVIFRALRKLRGEEVSASDTSYSDFRNDVSYSQSDISGSGSSNYSQLSPNQIYVKIKHKDEMRKVKCDLPISMEWMKKEIASCYGIAKSDQKLSYKDIEGDRVTIRRQNSLEEAVDEAREAGMRSIVFTVINTNPASTSEHKSNGSKSSKTSSVDFGSMFLLFESLLDPTIVINQTGVIQYTNPAIEKMTGWKPKELMNKNVKVLMTDDVARHHDNYLSTYKKTKVKKVIGVGRDVILSKKDGSIVPVKLQVVEKCFDKTTIFIGTLYQRQVESEVEKTVLQQEREVIDSLAVAACIINSKGQIQAFNSKIQSLLGYKLVEVVGKNINMLVPPPHASQHDSYISEYIKSGKSKIIGKGRKVAVQGKDGSLIPCFLSVTAKENGSSNDFIFTGVLQPLNLE